MISKKLFSVLLALCMVLSIMPAGLVAFADDDPEALHVGKNTVVSGTTYTFTPEEDGNYWFCSVSDFDVDLTVVNTETGDESYFDDYEEWGRSGLLKADNIRLVMERNGADKAIYVGDIQKDADASAKAGVPCIWAAYGFGHIAGPAGVLNKFSDLPEVLRDLGYYE